MGPAGPDGAGRDRKSTRLNSSHTVISYAVFCLKKKKLLLSSPRPQPASHGPSSSQRMSCRLRTCGALRPARGRKGHLLRERSPSLRPPLQLAQYMSGVAVGEGNALSNPVPCRTHLDVHPGRVADGRKSFVRSAALLLTDKRAVVCCFTIIQQPQKTAVSLRHVPSTHECSMCQLREVVNNLEGHTIGLCVRGSSRPTGFHAGLRTINGMLEVAGVRLSPAG